MTTHTIRTGPEILELKMQWLADGCWDIEETEGFEAHREELLAFRLHSEAEWKTKRQARLAQRASELGCSVAMAEHLESLESRIAHLSKELDRYINL